MTGRKSRALQVSPVVPYKALGNFPKAVVWALIRRNVVALQVAHYADHKAS